MLQFSRPLGISCQFASYARGAGKALADIVVLTQAVSGNFVVIPAQGNLVVIPTQAGTQ